VYSAQRLLMSSKLTCW